MRINNWLEYFVFSIIIFNLADWIGIYFAFALEIDRPLFLKSSYLRLYVCVKLAESSIFQQQQ